MQRKVALSSSPQQTGRAGALQPGREATTAHPAVSGGHTIVMRSRGEPRVITPRIAGVAFSVGSVRPEVPFKQGPGEAGTKSAFLSEIAVHVGCSARAAPTLAPRNTLLRGEGMHRGKASELEDHIVRLYYEHYTCRQIAELTGMAYRHVCAALRERGITPRQRGQRRPVAQQARGSPWH